MPEGARASGRETWAGRARARRCALGILAAAIAAPAVLGAQTLRGSPESVERMYVFAESHALPFYSTADSIEAATTTGRLVPLGGGSYILGTGVGWPSVTPETRRFVEGLAPAYWRACSTPLVVTSAVRPLDRQPRNANPHSVHPAGIAVDLRRPPRGPCLRWLRDTLTALEVEGAIEATEEHHPAHFHVAVLAAPGDSAIARAVASAPQPGSTRAESAEAMLFARMPHGAPAADADKLRARARLHVRLPAFEVGGFGLHASEPPR